MLKTLAMTRLRGVRSRMLPSSLTNRVFALYGFTLALFVSAGLGLFVKSQVLGQVEDTFSSSVMLVEVVAQAVQDSVLIGDYDALRKTLDKGVQGSIFASAKFIDLNGGRVEARARDVQHGNPPPVWLQDWVRLQLDDINRPVSVGGRDYGVLRLQFDAVHVAQEIWTFLLMAVGIATLSLLAGLVLIRIPLTRWLGSLDRLRDLVEALGTGRLEAEQLVAQDEPTEIRRVVEMLNHTTALVRDREISRRALDDQKFALDQHAIVSVADRDEVITYANDHFCQISGYARDELIGRTHDLLNSGHHPAAFYAAIRDATHAGQVWHGEICNRKQSGELYWVDATIVPLLGDDGRPHQYISIRTDVTDRKRFEEQLAAQRAFFERISETLGEGLCVEDEQGRCTYMNTEAERLLGWPRAEFLGRNVHETIHRRADDAADESHACAICQELHLQGEARLDDQVLLRHDGTSLPVALVSKRLFAADGSADGMVVAFQDITARQVAATAILQAKEAAEQANRVKSDFLANMSHEIRTPMNGIIGMTELTLDTDLTAEQREYLSLVKTSAASLLQVLNDILDFSKIEAGKLEVEQIEFSLEQLMRETVKSLALRAHEKGLELLLHVASDVPDRLVSDPGRLRQVLVNLIGNAIKFTERGEVEVSVVRLDAEPDGSRPIRFCVRDTGIGIAPEKQITVFESFSQADTSTTRHYGGTGLGLTISTQLVELMGGHIGVESEPGVGSSFHFTLNLATATQWALSAYRSTGRVEGLPVLVTDDNATNRRLLEQVLRSWKMVPTIVAGAEQALAEFERATAAGNPYAVALVDLQMPGMDGFELVEKMNLRHDAHAPTVMMLTSEGQRGHGARCRQLGVASYLVKPVSQSELLDALMTALGEPPMPNPPLITRHSLREARRKLALLLAEDNAVNQRLAVRLLEKLGHTVTVAVNGVQAVEHWRQGQFDAILMDIDMPLMNGYEATAHIREQERANGSGRIPIVAMTAHAMRGAREECLAHGMDGYLSKPIDTDALWLELDALAHRAGPPQGAAAGHAAVSGAAATPVADFDKTRQSMDNDRELFDELAQIYLRDATPLLTSARRGVAEADGEMVRHAAHAIKGMVSIYGARRTIQAAERLERLDTTGATAALSLAELEAAMDELGAALQAYTW
jgi:PAS domain S-box-containing protein